MAFTLKNIIQRTLTGIVYVAVIVASICVHPFLFMGVFGIITGLLVHEFLTVTKFEGKTWQRLLCIADGAYLFVASGLFAGCYVGQEIYMPYIIVLIITLIGGLYLRDVNVASQLGKVFFAQAYCAGFLSLLNFIPYKFSGVYDCLPVLMIFVFIWLNDTGAYLIGSWIGRRRLFERISPRKSWEGFWGGFAVTVTSALVVSQFHLGLSWIQWIVFAIVTVVAATFGDLLESLLKRAYGLKDSGKVLPGHGGMLDRLDSAILAAPVAYVFFELVTRN
ncbi:MAG: phosphatidate cytidylyltransferase [Tannerella sp.]|jgi:phosphatidate cytidylyltransferase|nr:phosphatidate cytidylyltransferase [Tannerella sp.]